MKKPMKNIFILLTMLCIHTLLYAQWQPNGIRIFHGNGAWSPDTKIIPDGSGGAIAVWKEGRYGPWGIDIYAQKVDTAGHMSMPVNGDPVFKGPFDQADHDVCSAGAGYAFVVWTDSRNNNTGNDLYAQIISSNGAQMFDSAGVAVVVHAGSQTFPQAVASGNDFLIFYTDWRVAPQGGTTNIYVQKLSGAGDTLFGAGGKPVCDTLWQQEIWDAIPDGSGGAFVLWSDNHYGDNNLDLYIQRVNADGNGFWGRNGIPICTASGRQEVPVMCADNNGGVAVAWRDQRAGNTQTDFYAQRFDANGVAKWTANGLGIDTRQNQQLVTDVLIRDGENFIFVWDDTSNPTTGSDVYAAKISPQGNIMWSIPVINLNGGQGGSKAAVGDGQNFFVAWFDNRQSGGPRGNYAQKISHTGTKLWQTNGVLFHNLPQNFSPLIGISHDNAGGVIALWYKGDDIYANRVYNAGIIVPVELMSFIGFMNRDNVELNWSTASETNNARFEIQRRTIQDWATIGFVEGFGTTTTNREYFFTDASFPTDVNILYYRLKQIDFDGTINYSETILVENNHQPAKTILSALMLCQNYPNPFNPSSTISYSILEPGEIKLVVLDMLGREVATLVNGYKPEGSYSVAFNATGFPNGMYFYRLISGTNSITKKMILVK